MLRSCLVPILLAPTCCLAQQWLYDDFSDGDFSAQPPWYGHTAHFVVNAEQVLQLNDPDPASTNVRWLSTPLPGIPHPDDTLSWTCEVLLDFAPSPANHARIYLIADQADLSLAQNAIYLQVGGISGSADALMLVRLQEGQATTLLSGSAGAVGQAPARARFRVRRLPQGLWTLEADYSGGSDLAFEGQASDTFLPQGWHFGLWCRYTATRATSFFFDDIACGPFRTDDQPPRLLAVEILGPDHLLLAGSEPFDPASAAQPDHFWLDPPDALVAESWRDAQHPTQVHLLLSPPLRSGQPYLLAAPGLTDLTGNAAADTLPLLWYAAAQPDPYDVLLTEIMADPNPSQGLPPAEYVELFNRTDTVFDLKDWTFTSNTATATLPHHYLLPGQYLILTHAAAAELFSPFGKVLALPDFPTLANSGATLQLRDPAGKLIHEVVWSAEWHHPDKAQGGWSLEMRRTEALCAGAENWGSTTALIGGTPGRPNSLASSQTDTLPPKLRWLEFDPATPTRVTLAFDEALSHATASDTAYFRLSANHTSLPILQAQLDADRPHLVHLQLAQPLPAGPTFTLQVHAGFADCMGNALPTALHRPLRHPRQAPRARLNEIMYQPDEAGAEYIELAFQDSAPLHPATFALALLHPNGDTSVAPLTTHRLWWPGTYLVLSRKPERVRSRYALPDTALVHHAELPTLPDEGATLLLLARDSSGTRYTSVETLTWSPDWHDPLLSHTRGISLERIRIDWPPTADNWHSAAATAGYATPTRPNSQYRAPATDTLSAPCHLLSPVVSPDGDGFEDVLLIACQLDQPAAARMRIFDAAGRLIWYTPELQWLGTHNVLQWDGRTRYGQRAPRGLYALFIELIASDGTIIRQRLGAAVW